MKWILCTIHNADSYKCQYRHEHNAGCGFAALGIGGKGKSWVGVGGGGVHANILLSRAVSTKCLRPEAAFNNTPHGVESSTTGET